jgi:hypothetical protein
MPTVSGFSYAGVGRRLISASAPVIFRAVKEFRPIGKKTVQGLRLID